MLTAVIAVAVLLAVAIVLGSGLARAVRDGPAVVAGIFHLERRTDWPRGVQEEDPPPAWHWEPR